MSQTNAPSDSDADLSPGNDSTGDPEYKLNNDGKILDFFVNLTIFKIYLMGFLFLPLLSATLIWTFSLQMKKVEKGRL